MAKKAMSSNDNNRGGALIGHRLYQNRKPAPDREHAQKVVKKVSGMSGDENQREADMAVAGIMRKRPQEDPLADRGQEAALEESRKKRR